MHCVDVGVTQEVIGNICSEYLEKGGLPGRSQKIRCETLWVKLKTWYKLVKPKSHIQTLTVTKFKRVYVTAPSFKAEAAETRHLAPFGVLLAQELYDWYQTDHAWHVLQCARALQDFYKVLEDWSTGDMHVLCQAVCEEYSWLNTETIALGKNVWRVRPKFHMFQEMAQFQNLELGNPRSFGEYKR
jgi:hypothetical protein